MAGRMENIQSWVTGRTRPKSLKCARQSSVECGLRERSERIWFDRLVSFSFEIILGQRDREK